MFLAIATNIPQRLKTGFVVQGHIWGCFTCDGFVCVHSSQFYSKKRTVEIIDNEKKKTTRLQKKIYILIHINKSIQSIYLIYLKEIICLIVCLFICL